MKWEPIKAAPKHGVILLLIGETIPEMPDIRVGSYIGPAEALELEGPGFPNGGWLIWNSASDFFVLDASEPLAWCSVSLPNPRSEVRT